MSQAIAVGMSSGLNRLRQLVSDLTAEAGKAKASLPSEAAGVLNLDGFVSDLMESKTKAMRAEMLETAAKCFAPAGTVRIEDFEARWSRWSGVDVSSVQRARSGWHETFDPLEFWASVSAFGEAEGGTLAYRDVADALWQYGGVRSTEPPKTRANDLVFEHCACTEMWGQELRLSFGSQESMRKALCGWIGFLGWAGETIDARQVGFETNFEVKSRRRMDVVNGVLAITPYKSKVEYLIPSRLGGPLQVFMSQFRPSY